MCKSNAPNTKKQENYTMKKTNFDCYDTLLLNMRRHLFGADAYFFELCESMLSVQQAEQAGICESLNELSYAQKNNNH